MTFKDWISRLESRSTPSGDLARDIKRDKSFPEENSREAIFSYLESNHACDGAIEAFKTTWASYQKYLKLH